jgi:hypothetical protein
VNARRPAKLLNVGTTSIDHDGRTEQTRQGIDLAYIAGIDGITGKVAFY